MENFKNLEYINKGSYSKVYKAKDNDNNIVAIKIINLHNEEGIPATALREIFLLRKFNNKNIISLKNVLMNKLKLFLIFEFCEFDLMIYISHFPSCVIFLYKDIILAINTIHRKKIIHRDLKPQNILVQKNGMIKIADFGLARSIEYTDSNLSNDVVTLNYRAPELLKGLKKYSYYIDMWSIGCIFYEMIVGSVLFNCYTEKQLEELISVKNLRNVRIELLSRNLNRNMIDGIIGCLNINYDERFTAEKMLKLF